ncbi:MAG: hypothetical protein II824_05595 [Bacteroidales bacterium]|nr:hypothetical protein [Bacteroidales bacterium]
MSGKVRIWLLGLPVVFLTACSLIYDAPDTSACPELKIAISFPESTALSKADAGEVPASLEENAIKDLSIWVFNHETKEKVTEPFITSSAADLPSAGGVRKYALPVDRTFLLTRPNVDVFVLVNQSSINTTVNASSAWTDLNNAIFGGNSYFSPETPVKAVPGNGLPMSGVGLNLPVTGEEPSLSVTNISVSRAVSKLRYIFSQMYTEDNTEEEYSIQKVVLDGNQIPVEEYVFSSSKSRIVPSNYVSASMTTTWPSGTTLSSCDAPEIYSYAGQDGPSYENLIADGISRGRLTDLGTFYLRESDKALTGTVYYTITKKGQNGNPDVVEEKTLPFSMAAPGDFARNHTWTVYGYFISNRTLQMAVSVLPWDKNNYTIEFSTASLQVTQKFTVDENSATVVKTDVKDHYNVFLDANRAAHGYLYVTTPQGGKLEIIKEGAVSDLEAFSVTVSGSSSAEATINPSLNGGRIDITIDRNRSYTGDTSGKTITLSFKAFTPDGDREISGASECIDQVYHFYL